MYVFVVCGVVCGARCVERGVCCAYVFVVCGVVCGVRCVACAVRMCLWCVVWYVERGV